MKKIIALTLALVMCLTLFAACGKKGANNGATEAPKEVGNASLQKVLDAGKLVIATSPDFPPFEELQPDGSVTGIEIELMELICKELGVTLEIAQMDFNSVLPGVQAGKYDAGVSGISVDEERKKNTLFTDPYCLAAQAIVVLEGSGIQGKADLEGKKISLQSGTTAEAFCMKAMYDILPFAANTDAQMALTSGKVAAWVIDDLTAKEMVDAYNATNPETKLVVLGEAMTTEPYAFAFKQGNDALVNEINTILAKYVADGTVKAIFDKYNAPYTSPAK